MSQHSVLSGLASDDGHKFSTQTMELKRYHWIHMGRYTGQGYMLSLDSFKASNTLHKVLMEKH
jgi:hypothetical protein